MVLRPSFSRSQPCCCSHDSKRATWLMVVTTPSVISAISASISGAAASSDLACSFSKGPIDVEAARVDPGAQLPQSLLRGRQRRQSLVNSSRSTSTSCWQYYRDA